MASPGGTRKGRVSQRYGVPFCLGFKDEGPILPNHVETTRGLIVGFLCLSWFGLAGLGTCLKPTSFPNPKLWGV